MSTRFRMSQAHRFAATASDVETHAIGVVMYDITALVYASPGQDREAIIAEACDWIYDQLLYWEANLLTVEMAWALFCFESMRRTRRGC